jgi:hypothetical protein
LSITIVPIDADRRVLLTSGEGVRGPDLADATIRAVTERPDLADWDWINDLRDPVEDSSGEDIVRIAAAFDAVSTSPSWTVFVSRDPNLRLWAQVMDHQFRHRRHLVADSPETAAALLDRTRSGS